MNNHKLIMGTPESKAKWHNVAKDTLYDYYPELDEDVKATAKHIDLSETITGKDFSLENAQGYSNWSSRGGSMVWNWKRVIVIIQILLLRKLQ